MFQRKALLTALLLAVGGTGTAEDVLVYTCYQGFNSRVYIMSMNGTVLDWFQYNNYRLCDLEVVNGDVHIVDAFAPRSFILDIETGDLELIIDDLSLFYFYDIAFDETYLYTTEWSMNRYLPDGTKDSSAGFSHDVLGSTFMNDKLYTINEDSLLRCWDISLWPAIIECPSAVSVPPSVYCRGLSNHGDNFWTAESKENQTGFIYCFSTSGAVIAQIPEPAFSGWGVCVATGYPSSMKLNTWASIKHSFQE